MTKDINALIKKINETANTLYELIGEIDPGTIPALERHLQDASDAADKISYDTFTYLALVAEYGDDQIDAVFQAKTDLDIHEIHEELQNSMTHDDIDQFVWESLKSAQEDGTQDCEDPKFDMARFRDELLASSRLVTTKTGAIVGLCA
ncbi:hypothetical protein SAMN05444279_12121 [Ruegeria intermedia]|uniref:Uncharacterized protein n=1 Tax=Ruegeria intermedia TaxID=996115 RepID=A0A1M4ZQQ1_9RHOB|nr:hypothetical protein [Ruegeria intermedia]SHF20328.1 hypothetical protein SAMN05444279_12121 [Ruegeria intermedia]